MLVPALEVGNREAQVNHGMLPITVGVEDRNQTWSIVGKQVKIMSLEQGM